MNTVDFLRMVWPTTGTYLIVVPVQYTDRQTHRVVKTFKHYAYPTIEAAAAGALALSNDRDAPVDTFFALASVKEDLTRVRKADREAAGKKVRGRMYPWGVVDVENPLHSDFIKLRTFLISTHMQDLKDTTQDVHYENFRMQCISQISQHALRERTKLKRESVTSTTDSGITETDRLLLQKDEEVSGRNNIEVLKISLTKIVCPFQIRQMQDMLKQMQEKLKASNSLQATESVIDV